MRQRKQVRVSKKNSGFLFHVLSFVKKIKICIYFKEVCSIEQIITVSALQTGQPTSAGDPTYRVNVFIQQPITRSEQLPHLAYVTAFLRTVYFQTHFRAIFQEKLEYPPRYERSSKYKDIKNENVASLTEKIFFRSVGFADWFVGLKGYSKFEPKPF